MARTVKPAQERREEILDAAQHLFTIKGFQAATMEDIMRAVGIAKGTLYHHFRGKDQILEAIVLRTVQQIETRAQHLADSPLPAMERFAGVLASARVDGNQVELIEELHVPANSIYHVMSIVETVRHLTPIVTRIVEDGIAEGTFHTAQPREVTEILLTAAGMLLDEGIFQGERTEIPRRTLGLIRAAETLLGCEDGALTALASSR